MIIICIELWEAGILSSAVSISILGNVLYSYYDSWIFMSSFNRTLFFKTTHDWRRMSCGGAPLEGTLLVQTSNIIWGVEQAHRVCRFNHPLRLTGSKRRWNTVTWCVAAALGSFPDARPVSFFPHYSNFFSVRIKTWLPKSLETGKPANPITSINQSHIVYIVVYIVVKGEESNPRNL